VAGDGNPGASAHWNLEVPHPAQHPNQEHPMPFRSSLRFVPTAVLFAALATACAGGGIEGKYYNSSSGEFAMELSGGKVLSMQGQEGRPMTYEVRGDSLVIHDPRGGMADQMTFGIEKDGTLSLGILGSLTKNRK
jgi:hypothetical protein